MNKIFNIVYSATQNCFVVCSELAKGRKKTKSTSRQNTASQLSTNLQKATHNSIAFKYSLLALVVGFSVNVIAETTSKNITPNDSIAASKIADKAKSKTAEIENTYFHINTGESDQEAGNPNSNLGPIGSKGGAIGEYSIAAGIAATAKGSYSLAAGIGAEATGDNALVIGNNITTDKAYIKLQAKNIDPDLLKDNWLDFTVTINGESSTMREMVADEHYSTFVENFWNSTQDEQLESMSIDLKNSGKNERQIVMGNSIDALGEAILALGNDLHSMSDKSVLVGNTLSTIARKSINIGTDSDIVMKSKVTGEGKSDNWYQSNFKKLNIDINGRQKNLESLYEKKKQGQLREDEKEFANMDESYIKNNAYVDLKNELDFEGQISIGHSLETAGGRTINLGNSSSTIGESSINLGNNLTTLGKYSINIGSNNNLQNTYGMILGNDSISWNGGIVIGNNSFNYEKTGKTDRFAPTGGIIIGDYAGSLGTRAGISIGYNARSVSSIDNKIWQSYEISPMNFGSITYSTALALGNYSRALNGIAIGTYAYAEVPKTILTDPVMGRNEKEVQAIAIGNGAIARENGVVSIGGNAAKDDILQEIRDKFGPTKGPKPGPRNAIAFTMESTIQSENSIYLGTNAGGNMHNSLAHGREYNSLDHVRGDAETERSSIYIGYSSGELSAGNTNIALGEYANHRVTGSQNISIGVGARATEAVKNVNLDDDLPEELRTFGERNIVLGNQILEDYSEVTKKFFENAEKDFEHRYDKYTYDDIYEVDENGDYVLDENDEEILIGRKKRINDTISVGNITKAIGSQSIALGSSKKQGVAGAFAEGERSIAIGVSSDENKAGAYAKANDSIALGTNSIADREAGTKDKAFIYNDKSDKSFIDAVKATVVGNLGAFSVGNDKETRQIINVAAGEKDSDAVNVAQLKQVANTPIFFTGDDKETVTKKLGDTLSIVGGIQEIPADPTAGTAKVTIAEQTITGNIGVIKESDGLEIRLAKNLIDLDSIKVGHDGKDGVDGVIGVDGKNGANGVTIVAKGEDGKDGADGHIIIHHLGKDGVDGADGKDATADIFVKNGTNGVDGTNGKPGDNGEDGMTRIVYKDKNETPHEVATLDDGLSFGADQGTPVHKKLNSQLDIIGDGTIETSVTENGKIKVALGNDIILGEKGESGAEGKPGKPGIDGSIGVNGKDGSSVVISGKDGISITGPKGKDGKDGISADINIAVGEPGLNGKDGITRIVYEDKDGNHQEVATLGDGLKFKGDDAQIIAKKLNTQLDIIGGADQDKLTENNIGVVSKEIKDEAGEIIDHKLVVKLAKNLDLGKDGSITTGNTVINNNGLTINNAGPDGKGTISITNNKIDMGGNKITNVADGEVSKDSTDAINGSQLHEAISNINISGGGRKITSKDGSVTVDGTTDPTAYDLSVKIEAAIEEGDKGAVSGDTVYNYLKENHYNQDTINKMFAAQEISYRANSTGTHKSVKLSDGLNFTSDKYLAASVEDNGEVTYGLSQHTIDILEKINHIEDGGDTIVTGDLTYKANGKNEKVVALEDGLDFQNGNYTTASVADKGQVTIDIDVEKAKADIIEIIKENTIITDGDDINLSGDENITVKTEGNDVFITLNPALENIHSISNGDTKVTINKDHSIDMGDSVIKNVADGEVSETSTEAINGSQLYKFKADIDNKLNQFDKEDKNLRAGVAGAHAAIALPQVNRAGKSMISAATGAYRGQNALAVGFSRMSDNGKFIFKLHGNTDSRGKFAAGAGVGYQW